MELDHPDRHDTPARAWGRQIARAGVALSFGVAGVCLAIATVANPAAPVGREVASVLAPPPSVIRLAAYPAGDPVSREELLSGLMPGPNVATGMSAQRLYREFVNQGYTLSRVREMEVAVPRFVLSYLPQDLSQIEPRDQRKATFIKLLLPLLLAENERILGDRERLLAIRAQIDDGMMPTATTADWLTELSWRYGMEGPDLDELVRRVDMIPPSLALAQAALETGWGTSRLAQLGQALFGQTEGRGKAEVAPTAIRTFDDLGTAVAAYARNLNSHRAYARFRAERAQARTRGEVPDGHELASHLDRYSERGLDYVREVQTIIRANNLRPFDPVRLSG